LVGVDDGENSDDTIGETGVEVLLILGPDEGSTSDLGLWLGGDLLLTFGGGVGLLGWDDVFIDEFLAWEIVDSDTGFGTDDEPVDLGGEDDNVDWGFGVNFFKMSTFDEVPDVNLTVSTTGGDEVGVDGEINGVDLSLVSNEGVHEGHHLVIPDIDGLIPGGRDNDWGSDIVEVSDAGNPVGMWVLVNGELALTVNVPNLNFLVHTTGSNLSIIWGEGNRENIFLVTSESLSSLGSLKVPESDGTIP